MFVNGSSRGVGSLAVQVREVDLSVGLTFFCY